MYRSVVPIIDQSQQRPAFLRIKQSSLVLAAPAAWLENLELRNTQDILQEVQDITPLLRTETLKELLIELFFMSDKPRTLSDLARAIDVDQTTVMREVNRLLETGVVVEERVGRSRTIAIDEVSPIAGPLRRLVRLAYDAPDAEQTGRDEGFVPLHAERPERRPLPSSRRRD